MECWHSRIHSGPSPSTFSAAEWNNADEVPRIVALQIFPPEESSSRVSIAGIFAPLSSSTDLCVMVYQFLVTFSQNRNLAYRKILSWTFPLSFAQKYLFWVKLKVQIWYSTNTPQVSVVLKWRLQSGHQDFDRSQFYPIPPPRRRCQCFWPRTQLADRPPESPGSASQETGVWSGRCHWQMEVSDSSIIDISDGKLS